MKMKIKDIKRGKNDRQVDIEGFGQSDQAARTLNSDGEVDISSPAFVEYLFRSHYRAPHHSGAPKRAGMHSRQDFQGSPAGFFCGQTTKTPCFMRSGGKGEKKPPVELGKGTKPAMVTLRARGSMDPPRSRRGMQVGQAGPWQGSG